MSAASILIRRVATFAVILMSGCGSAEVSEPSQPEWIGSLPEFVLPSEPVVSIGGLGQSLYRPETAMVAGDSVVVLLDPGAMRIWAIPLDGASATAWGGPGQGPAEFRALQGGLSGEGEVWIWDPGQVRVSRFNLRGELLDEFPLWSQFQVTGQLVGPRHPSCLWFARQTVDSARVRYEGYARGQIVARCVGESARSRAVAFAGGEYIDWRGPTSVPFGRTTLLTVSRGAMWASPTDSIHVTSYELDGDYTTVLALPALRKVVPQEAYDRIEGDLMRRLREVMPDGPHETYPDVETWWGDGDGGAWLGTAHGLVQLGEDGHPIARLSRPSSRLLGVEGRHAVTVRTDPLWGGPVVEVWELEAAPVRRPGP